MSAAIRLLVIDDDLRIRRLLRASLAEEPYTILEAESGEGGLRSAATERPDLILLDLGLPDVDGVEVARRIREWSTVPIVVLSGRDEEQSKVDALDAGADDFVTKPFSTAELLARLRAARRRAVAPEDAPPLVKFGGIEIDLVARIVRHEGEEVSLTPIEWSIVAYLAKNKGRVVTHTQLLNEVWGPEYDMEVHYLRVHIKNIRKKLHDNPANPTYIRTEQGVGYRLLADD